AAPHEQEGRALDGSKQPRAACGVEGAEPASVPDDGDPVDQPEEHFQPASQRRRAVRERLLDDSFEVGPPRRIQPGRFGHDRRDDGGEKALHARNLGVEKRSGNARSERQDLLIMSDGAMLVSDDRAGVVYRIPYLGADGGDRRVAGVPPPDRRGQARRPGAGLGAIAGPAELAARAGALVRRRVLGALEHRRDEDAAGVRPGDRARTIPRPRRAGAFPLQLIRELDGALDGAAAEARSWASWHLGVYLIARSPSSRALFRSTPHRYPPRSPPLLTTR